MLPILRVIPAGGVLLAIAILVLALSPPAGPHLHLTSSMTPPRGALISRDQHPEWRQFLILAALRRADELSKLRDLPDTPTRTAPLVPEAVMQPEKPKTAQPADAGKLAGVQANPPDQDDVTGTVQSPDAVIPVDIGESSSTELPVIPHRERPPVVMMPAHETTPPAADPTPPVLPKPQTTVAVPEPAKLKQARREAMPEPAKPKQPAQPKQESKAATPAPATSKQASREAAPEPATPTQPVRPKQESEAPAPAPATSKQASREAAPEPAKPKQPSPPKLESKPSTPAPTKTKQASLEAAPQSAKPKQPAQPKQESKTPAPAKTKTKQVRLEDVPQPPARPKQEIRHAVRESAKPRRESRHAVRQRAKSRHYARLARRAKRKQTIQPFNFFQFFFNFDANQPAARIRTTY